MTEEEERHTGRASSPYHKKCFPPYCDNASLFDKQAISKLERDDLEDKFIIYADENIAIKKQLRDQERHIQRLQTAIARQDNIDKKGGMKMPASMHYDNTRIDYLESHNKSLQAKVKVLKQQLLNHSYIHSKENKIAEMREKQLKSHSPDQTFQEFVPQSARERKTYSPRRSHRETPGGDMNASALKERIAVLEQLLETQKEKYKARITELEKSLSLQSKGDKDELSVHSRKLSDNVDMIRVLRLNQEHTKKISTLEEEHEAAMKDIAELQAALKQATANIDDLQNQLERERGKSRDAQGQLTKSVSHTETIRALEEQVRDLQNERKTLKETNEQLLQLTTGPQSKSDKSLQETKLKQQISSLERNLQDKIKELEEKQEQLITMESLLQNTNKPPPVAPETKCVQEVGSNGCLDCKQLKEQLCDVLSENQDLKQALETNSKFQREEAQKEIDDLNTKLESYLQEIDKLKKEPGAKDSGNVREKLDLEDRLSEAVAELQVLRPIASEHKVCKQKSAEKKNLELKLISALQEIDELKSALENKEKEVTPRVSRSSSRKTIERVDAIDVEYADLKDNLCTALMENQELRSKLGDGNKDNDAELTKKLLQAENDLALLRPIAADHEHCWQLLEENKELDDKLSKALQEIDYLKKELGQREIVPKSVSSILYEKISQTPTEASEKVSPVSSKHTVEEPEKSLTCIENTSRITFRTPEPISVKSVEEVSTKPSEMDCGDLKDKLCNALMENQMLRKQLGDKDKDRDSRSENEDLARRLRAALAEVQELKAIALQHERCQKLPSAVLPATHSEYSPPSQTIAPQVDQRKWPAPKKVIKFKERDEEHSPVPSRVRLMSISSPENEDRRTEKETNNDSQINSVLHKSAEEITPSLEKVKRLLLSRRVHQQEAPAGPSTSSRALRSSEEEAKQEEVEEEELDYQRGLSTKMEILNLSDSENISLTMSTKSKPTIVVKPCNYNDVPSEYYKMSTEVQNVSYSDQSFKRFHSSFVVRPNTKVVRFDPSRTAVVKYQTEEDILSVFLKQESKKTLPPSLKPSSHFAEGVDFEPLQQPVLVIVSKHEFETILTNEKKYISKSEILLPVQDKPLYNCRMEICVYDLELDNHLLDQLTKLERDPHVYVVWSFLGLEQRTVTMPASNAQFCTTVSYFGLITDPMVQHVKEKELVLSLMLERSGAWETFVGDGRLDLMPAFEQQSRGFVRRVPLRSSLGGEANVYVAFRMHECCESEEPPPVPTGLEVGIGCLRLDNKDCLLNPDATHLYVEYHLLGFCGPELETESMPRSDVIRFNHTKRLSVNDSNSDKLDPLLAAEDTESLRFNLIAEPCSLDNATDVQQIGHAEVNLLNDMVYKDEDIISKQVPVYNNEGEVLGKLSVTIIGVSTLRNRQRFKKNA